MELISIWYSQPKRRYKLFKETNFQITIKPIQKVPARFNFYKINYSTDHYEIYIFYRQDIKLYSVKISTLSEYSVKLKNFMKVAHFGDYFFAVAKPDEYGWSSQTKQETGHTPQVYRVQLSNSPLRLADEIFIRQFQVARIGLPWQRPSFASLRVPLPPTPGPETGSAHPTPANSTTSLINSIDISIEIRSLRLTADFFKKYFKWISHFRNF